MDNRIKHTAPIIEEDDGLFTCQIEPLLRSGYCIAPAAIIRSNNLANATKLYVAYLIGRHIPAGAPIQQVPPSALGISNKEYTAVMPNLAAEGFIVRDNKLNLHNINIMYGTICPFALLLDSRLTLQQKMTVLYIFDYINAIDDPDPLDQRDGTHKLATGVQVYQCDLDILVDIGYLLRIPTHTESLYKYAVNYNYEGMPENE